MTDKAKKAAAQKAYQTLCDALDANDWKYQKHPENLFVTCGARGDDLPMDLVIVVFEENQAVQVRSRLPMKVSEEKRAEMAVALAVANYGLVHGCFDFDVSEGDINFRITNTLHGCVLSQEAWMYLVYCACSTIDDYNDKLLMLSKGMLTLEKFVEMENQK